MATKITTSKLFRPRVLSTFCTKYTGFKHYTGLLYQSTATNTEQTQDEGLRLSDSCVRVGVFAKFNKICSIYNYCIVFILLYFSNCTRLV